MAGSVKEELVALSRTAWTRLRERLDGLDDDEYLWEPVPGCWTIRPRDDGGAWRPDFSILPPDPPPFTTIAWRVAHITDILGQERNATWLGLEPEAPDDLTAEPTAARALGRLDRAHDRWERYLGADALTDDVLWEQVGPIGGQYAEMTRTAFVLHEIDELIHHGAEVGLLRDWYRALHARDGDDPLVSALLRADRAAIAAAVAHDPGAVARVRAEHPDLVARAAAGGRWDAVRLLVEHGFAVSAKQGRTALHDAAGAGDVGMVRFLVEHGADTTVRDDMFNVAPLGWARYFNRTDVIELLQGTV
jgi:hypothetical protein